MNNQAIDVEPRDVTERIQMIDDGTKSDILNRLREAKADNAAMDATAFAAHYETETEVARLELMEFICQEAKKAGAYIRGCQEDKQSTGARETGS